MMILTSVDICIIMLILTFSVLYAQCFPDMMSKGYVSLNIFSQGLGVQLHQLLPDGRELNKSFSKTNTVGPLHTNQFCSESAFCQSSEVSLGIPTNTISCIVLYCNRFIILFTQVVH